MTPRMRELYERCCAHDGGVTGSFMTQADKWLLSHLKKQGWVETTEPDGRGQVRIRVVRVLHRPRAPRAAL
jgi:hypothetical protein